MTIYSHWWWGLALGLGFLWPQAMASPYELRMNGRLSDSTGVPQSQIMDFRIQFFTAESSLDEKIPEKLIYGVPITEGHFSLVVPLSPSEHKDLFDDDSGLWVSLHSITLQISFPGQRWSSVPFALRVPAHSSHLGYQSLGKLDFIGLAGAPFPSTAPSDGQILKWHSGGWTFEDDNTTVEVDTIGSDEIEDNSLTSTDLSGTAAITDSKLATITSPGKVSDSALSSSVTKLGSDIDLGSEVTGTLPLTHGGTGATTAGAARTQLGMGGLSTLNAISGAEVTDGSLEDVDFSATAAIAESKLAPITTVGKVSADAIESGTISGGTQIDTSGSIQSSGGFVIKPSGGAATELRLFNDAGDHSLSFKTSGTTPQDLLFVWPDSSGGPNDILYTTGSGQLSWLDAASSGALLSSQNLSDLGDQSLARTNLGLGDLATEDGVAGGSGGLIADGTLTDADFAATAQIPDTMLLPITSGGKVADSALSANVTLLGADISLSSEVEGTLAISSGGTGATSAALARTALGLGAIASKPAISGGSGGDIDDLTLTDADFAATAAITDTKLDTISSSGKVSDSALSSQVSLLGAEISLATEVSDSLPIANGGTNATTAAGARTNLGLQGLATDHTVSGGAGGTIADGTLTNDDFHASAAISESKLAPIASPGKVSDSALSGNVSLLGGDISLASEVSLVLPLSQGGTGANSAAGARSQLGLLGLATEDTVAGGALGSIADGSLTDADFAATAAISDSKLSTLTTAGKVSGSAITSGTISGSTAIDTTGTIATSGDLWLKPSGGTSTSLKLFDDSGDHFVALKAKGSVTADTTFSLPSADGDADEVLITNGSNLSSWVDPASLMGDLIAANNLSDLSDSATARSNLGLGALAVESVIAGGSGGFITDGSLTNDDMAAVAAIPDSKLATISSAGAVADSALSANVSLLGSDISLSSEVSGVLPVASGGSGTTTAPLFRNQLGLLALATLDEVAGAQISDGTLINDDLSATAAISDVKLATISTAGKVADSALSSNVSLLGSDISLSSEVSGVLPISQGGLGGSTAASSRTALGLGALAVEDEVTGGSGGTITDGTLVNNDFHGSAAISDSKLATISTPGKVSDSALSANVSRLGSSISLSSEVSGILPTSDGGTGSSSASGARSNLGLGALAVLNTVSGGSGGTIADGTLTNSDFHSSANIADSKLATISSAGKVANSATTATSSNVNNAIVTRDPSGDFSAGAISAASFSGDGTLITNMLKGYINGAYVGRDSNTQVAISPGTVEVGGKIAIITSEIIHTVTSLQSARDFHYIYIDDSQTTYPYGVDIIDTTTEPTYNAAKKGYYNGNDRCIGVVYSPSSSTTIMASSQSREATLFLNWVTLDTNNYADDTFHTLTTSTDPDIPVMATKIFLLVRAADTGSFYVKSIRTSAGTGQEVCAGYESGTCSLTISLPRGDRGTEYRNESNDNTGSANDTVLKGFEIER